MKSEAVKSAFERAREEVYSRREVRPCDAVEELGGVWLVVLGVHECDGFIYLADEKRNKFGGETQTPESAKMFDSCADAMAACVEVMRESLDERELSDYPPPEYPKVAYCKMSASLWFGSNS